MMKKILFFAAVCLVILGSAIACKGLAGAKKGPCDIYAKGGTPCVTAHSTTRLLYSRYSGPLYQVTRESDGASLDIFAQRNGIADAAAQDAFCEGTVCYISAIYDQSGLDNDLLPAPPGTFLGPDKGNFNTSSIADMAPALLDGQKVYGAFIMPGMGYRCNNARGLAIDDEPEGIYYVIDGKHYDSGCCFDYGNSSTNGRAVGTGTMETTYYGTSTAWGRGNGEGPWIMSDMEAGLFSGYGAKQNDVPSITDWRFVSVFVNGGGGNQWDLRGADASCDTLTIFYSGPRPHSKEGSDAYYPMHKKGGMLLGNGGDNGNGSSGTFFEGVMTAGYPSEEAIAAVQKNIAGAKYRAYPMTMSRITTFTPGSSTQVSVFFENTLDRPVNSLTLRTSIPEGWSISGGEGIPASIAPGERVTAIYTLTAPQGRSSGWVKFATGWQGGELAIGSRIRSAEAVKINEVAMEAGGLNPFIELYNASAAEVDLSGVELVLRRSGQASVRTLTMPKGTKIAAGGFLLLEQSPDAVLPAPTTIFTPVSTGPVIDFPAGQDNLPVTSTAGFAVGQKMGIALGGDYETVTVTKIGKPSTQTNLSQAASAGDTQLLLDETANLEAGSELTVDTGDRIEIVRVKTVVTSVERYVRRFGEPERPREQGIVELESPLKRDHAVAVDVSCPGSGIDFTPATRFAHESGDAVQPLGDNPQGLYATGNPDEGLAYRYALSTTAGSIALVDPASGAVIDAVVYGSQQSNSSGNGTIASPELATLEGVQDGGGCIAVVPRALSPFQLARMPRGTVQPPVCIMRWPDGADADQLCTDFRQAAVLTPGAPNRAE
jgi:hypothetical protein